MRIRMTDSRERLYENLEECAPEGTRSGALDHAARFYCKMHGYNELEPGRGAIPELLERAADQGSLTAQEIAAILHTDEYPTAVSQKLEYGFDHE